MRTKFPKKIFIIILFLPTRPTFASQITSGVALAEARNSNNSKDTKHSLFVMLRRYRGLKCGYGVTNKGVSYEPFKLQLHFREAPPDDKLTSTENAMPCKNTPSVNSSMLLVISATPVKSVYKSNDSIDPQHKFLIDFFHSEWRSFYSATRTHKIHNETYGFGNSESCWWYGKSFRVFAARYALT